MQKYFLLALIFIVTTNYTKQALGSFIIQTFNLNSSSSFENTLFNKNHSKIRRFTIQHDLDQSESSKSYSGHITFFIVAFLVLFCCTLFKCNYNPSGASIIAHRNKRPDCLYATNCLNDYLHPTSSNTQQTTTTTLPPTTNISLVSDNINNPNNNSRIFYYSQNSVDRVYFNEPPPTYKEVTRGNKRF